MSYGTDPVPNTQINIVSNKERSLAKDLSKVKADSTVNKTPPS